MYSNAYLLTQCLAGCVGILCGIHILKLVYEFWIRPWRIIRGNQNFPGPSTISSLKFVWEMSNNVENAFNLLIKLCEKYPIGYLWLGPRLMIGITNPKDIEVVMKSTKSQKKGFMYDFMKPLMVENIFIGYGPKMQAHRKLLIPMINGQHLVNYIETFNKEVCRYIDALSVKTELEVFDIYNETQCCLADISFETIFGIRGVAQSTGDLTLPHATETILDNFYLRIISPWLYPTCLYKLSKSGRSFKSATSIIHKFISKIIHDKKSVYMAMRHDESGAKKPKPSILNVLIENVISTHAMEDQEILYEITVLFIGFYDTVLGVFSFTILMLAMYPDIQDKIREEVLSIIGASDNVMLNNIGMFKYMDMVINETIRLFPVGPLLLRETTDDIQIDNYIVPKGSTIFMMAILTHKLESHWDEPNKFIPERFSPENSKGRHPFAFVPFSGGSRSCPGGKFGMSCLKVMIAQLIRKYRFKTTMKFEDLRLTTHISVRSLDGYKISIQKIDEQL